MVWSERPQRLKPELFAAYYGMAEAVPYPNLISDSRFNNDVWILKFRARETLNKNIVAPGAL